MMILLQNTAQRVYLTYQTALGTGLATAGRVDKNLAGALPTTNPPVQVGGLGVVYSIDLTAAETDTIGPLGIYIADIGLLATGSLDCYVTASLGGLDAAATRAAIGLASANLDTQLAAISALVTAAAIRVALGLGAANLDTQLAGILARLLATAIRADIGMASANLDTQLAAIVAGTGGKVVE